MKTIHIKVSFARWRFNWTRPRRATLPVSPSWPSSFLCRAVTRCQRLPCLVLPPPHFFPFFQGIHFSLSLSLPLPLYFLPPPSGRLSLKIFCWSSRDGAVSSAAFQLISSLPFNREQRGANRRGGGILHRWNRSFFPFSLPFFLRGKLLKDFCLSDWRCKCGFDGKFLMAGQRQWECWSVAGWIGDGE